MIDVAQADALILQHMGDLGTERVSLADAAGRILRERVTAERSLPPYDRVMMDGIAIRAGGRRFRRIGTQRAGMAPLCLGAAQDCIEAMTGAVLPEGADTVVPVERLHQDGDIMTLEDGYDPPPGQFIHRAGADAAGGAVLIEAGCRIHAPCLAILAGNGRAIVTVARRPRIGIVSTGDELVAVEAPVMPWQIRASNDRAIAGALRDRGLTDLAFATIADDLAHMVATLGRMLSDSDVLILSGGVSMGDFDFVPRAMTALGVTCVFHKIAQRPGKPMWFGIGPAGQRVFALPGNPVSALACCVRYVVPALLRAQGLVAPAHAPVRLAGDVARVADLTRFVPVRIWHDATGQALARPLPVPTSGDFNQLAATHGIIEVSPGPQAAPEGTVTPFHAW